MTDLNDLLERAPGALSVLETTSGRVVACNPAFADLLGLDVADVPGLELPSLVDPATGGIFRSALAALAAGQLDSCQGRGRVEIPNGLTLELVGSLRPLDNDAPRGTVVLEAAPVGSPLLGAVGSAYAADRATGPVVVCLVDHDWRLSDVSADSDGVLGWDSSHLGTALQEAVHPQDTPLFLLALGRSAADRRTVPVDLRLRTHSDAWTQVSCEISPLCEHNPARYAIAIRSGRTDRESTDQRVARLEGHLWRIVLEVQAAGVSDHSGLGKAWWTDPALAGLSERQAEIFRRVARGERVPVIARELFISESTVRNHLSAVYRKLGVHSKSELVARLVPVQ